MFLLWRVAPRAARHYCRFRSITNSDTSLDFPGQRHVQGMKLEQVICLTWIWPSCDWVKVQMCLIVMANFLKKPCMMLLQSRLCWSFVQLSSVRLEVITKTPSSFCCCFYLKCIGVRSSACVFAELLWKSAQLAYLDDWHLVHWWWSVQMKWSNKWCSICLIV